MAISLAGVAWWFSTSIGTISNILYPANYTVSRKVSTELGEVPPKPDTHKPIHYIFFNGKNSLGLIKGSQNLNVKDFSISFWLKSGQNNPNNFGRPIAMIQRTKTNGTLPPPRGWAFDTANVKVIGNNKLQFYVGSNSGILQGTRPTTLSSNNWTHIVGTFDGTNVKLYRNHLLVRMFQLKGAYALPFSPTPIKIGSSYWRGFLSDVQIFSRPLSQFEITSIFRGQDVSNGLIGRWKLDEGSGNSILDVSGNGNNGIMSNVVWR